MDKIKVGIFGGSGYGGAELLRILLFHPGVEVTLVTAGEKAGRRVDEVHPNLRQLTDLAFVAEPDPAEVESLDCLFLALPHGQSMEKVPAFPPAVRIIDLGADFRLSDPAEFQRYYQTPHAAPELQQEFVYGLTEVNRSRIRNARRVANPGCFATAILLAAYPLIQQGILDGDIIVDAKTGSSGSGARPADNTHHPRRANSFYAYKLLSHQHEAEIAQSLKEAVPGWSGRLLMQTHSAPMVRGIFASLYARLASNRSAGDIADLFREAYGDERFVRLVDGSPDVNWVKNTNFVDIGWAVSDSYLAVFSALDNLVKGAAGQAVQNMNLMFGLEEETGILFAGAHP